MSPEESLEKEIAATTDWRGDIYKQLLGILLDAAPELKLQWKWNCAVWVGKKDVVYLSPFKNHMKINFAQGAHLVGFEEAFNNGLEARNSRSIDFFKQGTVDEDMIKRSIVAAVKYDHAA